MALFGDFFKKQAEAPKAAVFEQPEEEKEYEARQEEIELVIEREKSKLADLLAGEQLGFIEKMQLPKEKKQILERLQGF